MSDEDVLHVINLMADYADKQNNRGLKNVILVALLGLVCSIIVGVIGYGYSQIYALSEANADLKTRVTVLENKTKVSLEEQNRVMFELVSKYETMQKTICEHDDKPEEQDSESYEKIKVGIDGFRVFRDQDGFDKFHDKIQQRIDERTPDYSRD
jgi:uncharacterized protein HemX